MYTDGAISIQHEFKIHKALKSRGTALHRDAAAERCDSMAMMIARYAARSVRECGDQV